MPGRTRIGLIIAATLALVAGLLQLPAQAASGGSLWLEMGIESGSQLVRSRTVPAGQTQVFAINWTCNEAACTNVKVVVPFAEGLVLGSSTIGGGWTDTRAGNTVTFSRANIPTGSGGQLKINVTAPAYTTPDDKVFTQLATIQGFGSNSYVDAGGVVTLTSQAASTTGIDIFRESGGGVDTPTTFRICAKIENSLDATKGPLGVQENSVITVTLPPGIYLEPDDPSTPEVHAISDGGVQVGNTIRWVLPAVSSSGCIDRTFTAAFREVDGNAVGQEKKFTATWFGKKVGSASSDVLGSVENKGFVIIPPPSIDTVMMSLQMTDSLQTEWNWTDPVTPSNPSKVVHRGDIGSNFLIRTVAHNKSTIAADRVEQWFDVLDVLHVTKATGIISGEGGGELWIKVNDGSTWVKQYEFAGRSNYDVDFYDMTSDKLVAGHATVNSGDEITGLKIVSKGPINPEAGEKPLINAVGVVRSTYRSTNATIPVPDLGPADQGYEFVVNHKAFVTVDTGQQVIEQDSPQTFGIDKAPLAVQPLFGCQPGNAPYTAGLPAGQDTCGEYLPQTNDGKIVRDMRLQLAAAPQNDYKDPVYILFLPDSRAERKPGTPFIPWNYEVPDGSLAPNPPIEVKNVTIAGVIGTAYVWKWDPGKVMPKAQGGQWKVYLDVRYKDKVWGNKGDIDFSGNHAIRFYALSQTTPTLSCLPGNFWSGPDANTLGTMVGEGAKNHQWCVWGNNGGPSSVADYKIEQKFKGEWDDDYKLNPSSSFSTPGHVDSMKVSLLNEGTKPLVNGTLLTRLPRPGDKGYTTTNDRNPGSATFPVLLDGKPTLDTTGLTGTGDVKTWWTSNPNQCASEFGSDVPRNCDTSGTWTDWDVTAPTSPADVASLKFTFGGDRKLMPFERFEATMTVTTPTVDDVTACDPGQTSCEITYAVKNTTDPNDPDADERAVGSSLGIASPVGGSPMGSLASPEAVLRMPSVLGPNEGPPTPPDLTSEGEFQPDPGQPVHQQEVAIDVPAGGSVQPLECIDLLPVPPATIVDPDLQCRVNGGAVEFPGVGSYTLDQSNPTAPKVVFTPAREFAGIAHPVRYSVTDKFGQTGSATYTPTVHPPAAPEPDDRTSTGVGTAVQSSAQTGGAIAVPSGGSLKLVDPSTLAEIAGDEYVVAGEGTYTLNPATGVITFEPELGFSGVASPARFQVADKWGQTALSSYTPTVTKPSAPTASPRSKQVLKNTTGTVKLDVPAGGSIDLLVNGIPLTRDPVTGKQTIVVADKGTYTLDPATGIVTFEPVTDYVGPVDPISYQVTDAYGSTATSSVTVTVTTDRPAPQPDDLTKAGPLNTALSVPVPLEPGDVLVLLDSSDQEQSSVTVAGQGTYTITTDSEGKQSLTFTPDSGWSGTATPVKYKVTDSGSQSGTATYTPTIWPAGPNATDAVSDGKQGSPQSTTVPLTGGESVKLVHPGTGQPVNKVTIPGVGQYVLDPSTGKITFTPEPDFTGDPDPVSYRVTGAVNQTATATYQPTVVGPPAATPRTTRGPKANDQTATVTVPVGGSVALLDLQGDEVAPDGVTGEIKVVIPSEGTYLLDPVAGVLTFEPDPDFTGDPTPIGYRLKDKYDQTGSSTFAPKVVAPPAPDDKTTSAGQGVVQTVTVAPPAGGHVSLLRIDPDGNLELDGNGDPVPDTSVTIPGKGTFAVVPETGVITFTPLASFFGSLPAIPFRVHDEWDQTGGATYSVTVTEVVAPPEPPAGTEPPAGLPGQVTAKPSAPKEVKVKQKGKKVTVKWKKPSSIAGAPVQWYRLTLIQRGVERVILVKNLSASVTKVTFTRAWLLKNSTLKPKYRGDVRGPRKLKYKVKIEAFNSLGSSPVSAKYLQLVLR